MKYIRLTYILLLISSYCQAQVLGLKTLSGKVSDSVSLKPMPFVTVTLMATTDSIAKYTLTDSSGTYLFKELHSGTYSLKFSMVGYRTREIKDIHVTEKIELPNQLMASVSITLADVTVTAGKIPISLRTDGFIYDARRDIPVAGENASDLLRKLPAIMVSPEGTPSIRGSSAIRVFIDDRPSEAFASSITDALKQVPSENIARIEVITQPSARYDAEGVDAVILIFTKKPVNKGLSGAVNGQGSNRNASFTNNLNIRHNKWIMSIGSGYYYNNNPSGNELIRNENNGTGSLRQQRDNKSATNSIFASLNVLYNLDTLSSWNAGYRFSKFWGKEHNVLFNSQSLTSGTNEFVRIIDNMPANHMNTLNAGYVKKSKDRKTEINILGLYFYQKQSPKYLLEQTSVQNPAYRESNLNVIDNQELSVQGDLTKETKNKSAVETGIKATYRDFANSNALSVYSFSARDYFPDPIRSNRFWFGRTILAGYVSYLFNLEEWKIRAGIRYEHTILNAMFSNVSFRVPDYKNLLPSLLISHSLSREQQFSLGYSKKILRPYIAYMNPVVSYLDSLNLEFGNPNLRPVETHTVEGAYTLSTRRLTLSSSVFYNHNRNSIENIRTLKPGGIIESTYMNIASNKTLGAIFSLSVRSGKWGVNTSHTVRYITYNSQSLASPFHGTISSHYLNVNYRFDPGFSAELSGMLNAGQINYQGTVTGTQWYSVLVTKNFKNGKCGISLRLDNFATPTQYVTEEIVGDTFYQHARRHFPMLLTQVGFFYKIGKKEVEVPATRRINSDS